MKDLKFRFHPKLLDCFNNYGKNELCADIGAGISVGILALPLAMAFAIASGVSPAQGLYTAVIAGLIISLCGGSRVQIGGPTGAFIVIVSGIIAEYGYSGLATATVMAGIILLVMGLTRMGNAIKYIPRPLVLGFTNGIAVLIMSTQIKDFFGLEIDSAAEDFLPKVAAILKNIYTIDIPTSLVGVVSILTILCWPKRWRKRIPGQIAAIVVGTAAAMAFAKFGWTVETIHSKFGDIPRSLPEFRWIDFELSNVKNLLMPAVTIAILAAIESLLSAVVADGMIDDKHDSNQELLAQGLANVAVPFFYGNSSDRRHSPNRYKH